MTDELEDQDEFAMDDSMALTDGDAVQILMHRGAHFGGSFEVMLEYYERDGRGVQDDITIERLEEMAAIEKQAGGDLAAELLSGAQAEELARIRHKYTSLKEVYDMDRELPKLVADLVLTEDLDGEKEIDAILQHGKLAVISLCDLLGSPDFYNPLMPGYGQGPSLAAEALGRIGNPLAIKPLFEALGRGDFSCDGRIIHALFRIGDEAREFLLKRLATKPISRDNENASVALSQFEGDEIVAKACFNMLKCMIEDGTYSQYAQLTCYLAANYAALPSDLQETYSLLRDHPSIPPSLKEEMTLLGKVWK